MRATPGAHGYDLVLTENVFVEPGATALLPTGLKLAGDMPPGIAMTIWPRSSTFKKMGLLVGNSIGLIDTDYTGEIMVMVYNTRTGVQLPSGTKLAQLVFLNVAHPFIQMVDLPEERVERGGFGSTGA